MLMQCFVELLVIPNELRQVLHTFLGLLTNEAIIHTRILCRMSIILVQEISVFLIERGLWLSEIAAGDNNVQELRTCLLAVLFSLNHIEEGHFRNSKEELPDNWLKLHPLFCAGQEIAFRVKQDHIGAVSLFKFVLELTRRIKDSQLLCNILKDESTFSSLVAQIALSSQLSSHQSGRTPIQPEKGMIGALANYCFSYLMNVQEDCEGPR